MPLYRYKSLNQKGIYIRGQLTAANEVDLEKRLYDTGLDLIDFREVSKGALSSNNKISTKELILFCIQLQQLEKAGVPIVDALNDLRDTAESPRMKNLMSDIVESVSNGSILSAALASHPEVFDEVFIGLVATGEKTGQLSTIFLHLADHLKWVSAIKSKVKKASTYPLFLLVLMCGIIALMMLFVIPKLSTFLKSQSFELPIYTKALISTSAFFQEDWYYVFSAPIIIYFVIKVLYKSFYRFAYIIDKFVLWLPVFGPLSRKLDIARFCRFFAITYKSGIGIIDCLDISAGVVSNKIIKESITAARNSVFEGVPLTASLKSTGQFPTLVVRMIKVGEDGGNLDETLASVNFFYDKEVEEGVDRLLGMIQPSLTIIMGGLMFWVTAAVFGPLYSSFSKMNF